MTGPARDHARGILGGVLIAALGLGAVLVGQGYPTGTLTRMGPGFFPVALGALLAASGVLVALTAKASAASGEHGSMLPDWRGWAGIVGGMLAFGMVASHAGLVPGAFTLVFVSALADRRNGLLGAALLAVLMVTVCVLVFVLLLKVPFPLFGPAG